MLLLVASLPLSAGGGVQAGETASPAGCPTHSKRAAPQTIASVAGPDIVALADGRRVRLVGALPPLAPARLDAAARWEPEVAATAALRAFVGAAIGLRAPRSGRKRRDRYGHILALAWPFASPALVEQASGAQVPAPRSALPLQEVLLRAGHARVYPNKLTPACAAAWLRAEASARARQAGLWAHPYYRVLRASELKTLLAARGSWQIVKGRVRSIGIRKTVIYLNFSDKWQTDFTVRIRRRRKWVRAYGDQVWGRLQGRTMRVRGYIKMAGGPAITVNHPGQLELLTRAGRLKAAGMAQIAGALDRGAATGRAGLPAASRAIAGG